MLTDPPLIAIAGELLVKDAPTVHLPTRYAAAIERAGGIPLVLAPVSTRRLDDLLERVDGVLFSGGDDFDTEALGLGPTHPRARPVPAEKQAFDVTLARAVVERCVPVLGICYGMQLLALAPPVNGARLFQHLPEDRPGCREHSGGVRHAVRVAPGTKLAGVLGVAHLTVVSRHHQALSDAGAHWTVAAADEEGTIEAIERADHPFALGVQWHPELAPDDEVQARLFVALVDAAREHRAERRPARGAMLS